jgi:hypothetical protein
LYVTASVTCSADLYSTLRRPPEELREYTGAELHKDLAQLKGIIDLRHPKFYTDGEARNHRYDQLYERVANGMNELEFYRAHQ